MTALTTIHDLLDRGAADEAVGLLRPLLEQSADDPEALAAVAGAFRRALEVAPGHVTAALGWADTLALQGRPGEARFVYEQVLALDPGNGRALEEIRATEEATETLLKLAFAADQRRAYGEARDNYADVLALNPASIVALNRLVSLDGLDGRLADADMHHAALVEALSAIDLASVHWVHLAFAAYLSVMRPLPRAIETAVCAQLDRALEAMAPTTRPAPKTGGRLKIGYLSTFLRDHPIGHVTAGLFAAHDRTRFETHVFYLPEGAANPYTDQIKAGAEHFHILPPSPDAAAVIIGAASLDVLIYLDGYMSVPLLSVIARRPAPVQVYWLGHAGGCELSAIDVLLADEIVLPKSEEALYRAKVVRLPGTYHPASAHPIGADMTRAEAGLPETGFVFCAFNNPEKIDTPTFDVWMRILKRTPSSVLWLSRTDGPEIAENLRAAALARGVAGERLIFAARLADKAAHLARHRCAGLFLDTLGLNASTTALDALWAGLPVLTVKGARFASRIATSFLTALDLPDLICDTPQAFEDRAVVLARDASALQTQGDRLAAHRTQQPLFQIEGFCRKLEAALIDIAARHRR